MEPTTSGRFRVLESPRDEGELVFVDVDTYEPTYVAGTERGDGEASNEGGGADEDGSDDHDELRALVRGLRPGYVVDATLGWRDGTARVREIAVVGRSLVSVVDGVTGLFEVARETCRAAAAAGEAVESTVTYDTGNDPNGVLYAFADEGAGDTFDAFRRGDLPLEPLLQRAEANRPEEASEAFLMRPAEEPFVLFYIAFRKGGVLADTVRDTYGSPRPDEPLVETGAGSDDDTSGTVRPTGEAADDDAADDDAADTTTVADPGDGRDGPADVRDHPDPWDDDAWVNEESDPWRD